jgi:hypothetical protein
VNYAEERYPERKPYQRQVDYQEESYPERKPDYRQRDYQVDQYTERAVERESGKKYADSNKDEEVPDDQLGDEEFIRRAI